MAVIKEKDMKLIVLSACFFLLAFACKRYTCCEPPVDFMEMVRTQTQCADPWGYGSNNDETTGKLKSYLLQKNILVGAIELRPTGEQVVCLACNCSKGFVFHVKAAGQYIDSLKGQGFALK